MRLSATLAAMFWASAALVQDPELAVVVIGTGDPPIVVLHGGPGLSHDYLRPEWDRLADSHRVIFYDQRGCGATGPAPSYRLEDHLSDLARVIDDHANGRAVLAGSSWGAQLALLFALEHPERTRGAVLSGFPWWPSEGGLNEARQIPHLIARLDSLERGLSVAPWPAPDTIGPREPADWQSVDRAISERAGASCPERPSIDRDRGYFPPYHRLSEVKVPILVVQGLERLHEEGGVPLGRAIPHAEVVLVRGAGHDPWAAQPDAFFRRVREFSARLR